MKNAVLLHGTGASPDNFWFPWLKRELAAQGFKITAPQMPHADKPTLASWASYALQNCAFDSETIVIGHSAGCPTALAVLERLAQPVRRAILVAGFIRLKEMKDDDAMLLSPDWDKIKGNARDFFFFNTDNDPWGCDHRQGEALREKLGGTLIIRTGEGHFGSRTFKQPYDTFPLLKDVCLLP